MRPHSMARLASPGALALIFAALVLSSTGRAAPLAAGGNHTGEDHSLENHSNETLTSIILTDATLQSSNLRNSILDAAVAVRTDFSNAQLRNTSFLGATLTDASFAGARLRDADLTGASAGGADFSGAVFRNATLAGVDFDGANLTGSNARGADFSGASFLGADLSGMIQVDPNAFNGAFYDFATVVDPGFDTSQMVFVPEPRPIVFIAIGLVAFAALPDSLRLSTTRTARDTRAADAAS